MKPVGNHNPAVSAYRQQTRVASVDQPSPAVERGDVAPERSGGSTRMSISSHARELAAGGVDTAKVEALRKRLDAGTLQFDALAIAEKMLAE